MNKSKKILSGCALITLIPFFAMASDDESSRRVSPVGHLTPPVQAEDPLLALVNEAEQAVIVSDALHQQEGLADASGAAAAAVSQELVQHVLISKVLGNGDCFFYALGVPRADVELMLLIKIKQLDEGTPLKQKLQTYLDDQLRAPEVQRSNIFVGKEASFDQNVVGGYILELEADDEMCDVEALAHISDRHVEVYQASEKDPRNLILVGNFNNTEGLPTLRVLQSGGFRGGHFDLIALEGTPEFEQEQRRGEALQEIAGFNEPGEEGRQDLLERLKNTNWTWSHYQRGPLDDLLLHVKMERLPEEERFFREELFRQTLMQMDRESAPFMERGQAIRDREATEALIRFMQAEDNLTEENDALRRSAIRDEFSLRNRMYEAFVEGARHIRDRETEAEATRVKQHQEDEELALRMQQEDERTEAERKNQQRQADETFARQMVEHDREKAKNDDINQLIASRRVAFFRQREEERLYREGQQRRLSYSGAVAAAAAFSPQETRQSQRPLSAAEKHRQHEAQKRRAALEEQERQLNAQLAELKKQDEEAKKPGGKKPGGKKPAGKK